MAGEPVREDVADGFGTRAIPSIPRDEGVERGQEVGLHSNDDLRTLASWSGATAPGVGVGFECLHVTMIARKFGRHSGEMIEAPSPVRATLDVEQASLGVEIGVPLAHPASKN